MALSVVEQAVKDVADKERKPVVLWLFYAKDAYTTARHMDWALRAQPNVLVRAFGPNNEVNVPNRVNFAQLAVKEKPDAVLVMDGPITMELAGLEHFAGPKFYYALDTHLKDDRADLQQAFTKVYVAHRQTLVKWAWPNLAWLPHAAEPELHHPIPYLPSMYDVAFVGGIDLAQVHWRRRRLLKALVDAGLNVLACRTTGLWMSFAYTKAKLVFNCTVNGDLNMRLFEGCAVGRPVLMDVPDKDAGFEEAGFVWGENVVQYEDATLVDIVKALLADEPRRTAIGEKAQALVLSRHTYGHRARQILADVRALLTA